MPESNTPRQLSPHEMDRIRSMRPGMWLDVQAHSPTSMRRARSDLIGIDFQRRMMVIRYPDESKWGNLRDAIHTDGYVILRFILEHEAGEVVAFKSKVKAVLMPPVNYVLVNFPKEVESLGLRSEQRVQTKTPVTVLANDGKDPVCEGHIVDISHTGCRVSIENEDIQQQVSTGTSIVLGLTRVTGKSFQLEGVIKNLKTESDKHYFGIKFESSPEKVEELLTQMMIEY